MPVCVPDSRPSPAPAGRDEEGTARPFQRSSSTGHSAAASGNAWETVSRGTRWHTTRITLLLMPLWVCLPMPQVIRQKYLLPQRPRGYQLLKSMRESWRGFLH